MGVFDRFLRVRVITAEPENLLSKLSGENIELWEICFSDLLTVECKIRKNQLSSFEKILKKSGNTYRIIKYEGLLWRIKSAIKRPVFLAGILAFLICAVIAPNRVYFVEVAGNADIPDNLILFHAEEYGIQFGTKISKIRSEEVKNQLLASISELQWVGITTSGSVVTIQVKERSKQEESIEQKREVSSVVAARDGIISQMTVRRGNPLYSVGQKVNEGDVLVSGYTDCGIKIIAENAEAEVFAYTLRENRFISPVCISKRETLKSEMTCYQLHLGKKVINLCNHSGISDVTCVKMYSENYWTLPGGFQLPVSVIKVNHFIFEQENEQEINEASCQWLMQFARSHLQQQMIAGTILDEDLVWEIRDDACVLTGAYACNEMIGQVKYEEIIEQNAEDN